MADQICNGQQVKTQSWHFPGTPLWPPCFEAPGTFEKEDPEDSGGLGLLEGEETIGGAEEAGEEGKSIISL